MSGSSAGYSRAVLTCEKCGSTGALWRMAKKFVSFEKLPDPFPAKCGVCEHEANYQKSAVQLLFSTGLP
jgi:hypothetical protein